MIYLKAFIGDKQYNDELVSVDNLAGIFNQTAILQKQLIDFTHINIVPDPLNGGMRYPQGLEFPSMFTAVYNGQQIEVRYSEGSRTVVEGNVSKVVNIPDYLPILSNREIDSIITAQNKEKALFFLLHPRCATSPLKSQDAPLFRYLDKEAENKQKNDAADIFDDLMSEIKDQCRTMPEVIVRKAKVIAVNNATITGVNWSADYKDIIQQVRSGLRELARINPHTFKEAWQSPDLELKSLIGYCFDKGIMLYKTEAATTTVSFGGNPITSFDHIEDKVINVQMWVNKNYEERYSMLVKAVKNDTVKQETEKAAKTAKK